jgi:hypothetical protein
MDFDMIPLEQTRLSATPGKLVRSYGLELRGWATRVGIRYAVALATLVAGAICFLVSVGIVLSAFFYILEMRYGIYAGYEILGGLFLALGVTGTVIGIWLLKREKPPLPRPRPQVEILKQSMTRSTVLRFLARYRWAGRPGDPATQILVGAAALLFIGWIAASQAQRSPSFRRRRKNER